MIILNTLIILSVLFGIFSINKIHKIKLQNEELVLTNNLKNKHLIPYEEVAKAFFDSKEVLWILTKDTKGREVLKRADGKPSNNIDDDYEYQYLRDNTTGPL